MHFNFSQSTTTFLQNIIFSYFLSPFCVRVHSFVFVSWLPVNSSHVCHTFIDTSAHLCHFGSCFGLYWQQSPSQATCVQESHLLLLRRLAVLPLLWHFPGLWWRRNMQQEWTSGMFYETHRRISSHILLLQWNRQVQRAFNIWRHPLFDSTKCRYR